MELHLYERLTHQYRDGWSGLDDDQYVGTVKMLRPRLVRDDGIDGHKQMAHVFAPAKLGNKNLSRAIMDTLSVSRCRHEHDCCGCASTMAIAKRLSRRSYAVELHTTYNV